MTSLSSEISWPTNAKLALQRTLAGRKIVCMSGQEAKKDWPPERIEFEMKQAMFYGTFYYLTAMPGLYDRWIPLTTRLAKAGWEPITHARCPALGPMVERFGGFAGRNLHFTLRNETADAKFVGLDIDADMLGLNASPRPDIWLMRDARTHQRLEVDRDGPRWLASLTVPPKDTVVLRVATPFGLALDHLFAVPDLLLTSANYRDALRDANAAVVCPDYEALAQEVQVVQSALMARDVQSANVLVRLEAAAAGLTVPDVQPRTAETKWWSERLTNRGAAARQGMLAAVSVLSKE